VAFHFRWVKKEGPDQTRNYPLEQCDRVAALCLERGHSVCCVGHPRYSYCPAGVEDLRSEDLEASIAAISSARLLAGTERPMHWRSCAGAHPDLGRRPVAARHLRALERFPVPTFIVANDTHRPETTAWSRRLTARCANFAARKTSPSPVISSPNKGRHPRFMKRILFAIPLPYGPDWDFGREIPVWSYWPCAKWVMMHGWLLWVIPPRSRKASPSCLFSWKT